MATLIVKATEACNGRCAYCAAEAARERGTLSPDDLARILELFRDAALRRGRRTIHIIWHGGEPLILPDAFYARALDLEEEILGRAGIRVENRMQTNLTLLAPERLPLLRRLLGPRGVIGTSIDPIPGIRRLAGPRGDAAYEERWSAAARLLREHGIRYGIVYVVHRRSLGRLAEIYRTLRSEHPGAGIRFNPIYREGKAKDGEGLDLAISPEEWGEALIELHRIWDEDGRPGNILPFGAWEACGDRRSPQPSCETSGCCARDHWGIDPRGDIFLCGRSADGDRLRYGNVRDLDADSLLRHPLRQSLANRSAWLRDGPCRGCPWWHRCRGGCTNDAWLASGTPFAPTGWCAGLKRFFEATFAEDISAARRPVAPSPSSPDLPLRFAAVESPDELASIERDGSPFEGVEIRAGTWSAADLERIRAGARIRIDAKVAAGIRGGIDILASRSPKPLILWRDRTEGDPASLDAFFSAGLPVIWESGQDPRAAIERYLHDPGVRSPLEPYHGLFLAIAKGLDISLWDVAGPCPERRVFFDARGNVAADADDLAAGRFLGATGDPPARWLASGRAREIARARSTGPGDPCIACPAFRLCRGRTRFAGGECGATRAIVETLFRAAAEIRNLRRRAARPAASSPAHPSGSLRCRSAGRGSSGPGGPSAPRDRSSSP
ncbi:MAG: radical SAM protein [Planctomycetes bacterium]|nr:radical SAM protein [Planctomycetota bacterium]